MKIEFPASSIRQYFDRNASDVSIYGDIAAAAPHGATTRCSYTVPANRRAYITGAYGRIMRLTAATGVNNWGAWLVKNLATVPIYLAHLISISNSLGSYYWTNLPMNNLLIPGDTIGWQTYDSSTGGTCTYFGSVYITEFDALA